jgi:protein-tyrosine-phosphatase
MGFEAFLGYPETVKARLAAAARRLEREFGAFYDRATIHALLDESARRLTHSDVTAFVPVLAERFARERLRAQAQAEGLLAKQVPEVVFVSLTGGGRAQIGAALLARRAGPRVSVHSAGSQALTEIDPNVRAAMEEVGIDLRQAFTKPLTPEVLDGADIVVTMGRSVGEVEIPATTRHVDGGDGDPAGATLEEVRRVRDDIARRVDAFAEELIAPLVGSGSAPTRTDTTTG